VKIEKEKAKVLPSKEDTIMMSAPGPAAQHPLHENDDDKNDDEQNELQQQQQDKTKIKLANCTKALIRTLDFAGVKFLRYQALDVANGTRCKVKPIKMLKKATLTNTINVLENQVCIAKVCFGGLPNFCDVPSPGCGLTAKGSLVLVPDLCTLRILPYASPDSAMVLCNLHEMDTGKASELCTRSLLQRIVTQAAQEHQIAFNVGVELEFCLFDQTTNAPVDVSNFSNTTTLNQQQSFISDVYSQLERQDIRVELIHAESMHGQLEIVLKYCHMDPVAMADQVVQCRETIVHVARIHNLKAVFLPKIDPNSAGNGCHVHFSFCDLKTGRNLFPNNNNNQADNGEESIRNKRRQSFILGSDHNISAQGRSFMEGILQNLPALLALTIPTANSFRRGKVYRYRHSTTANDKHAARFVFLQLSFVLT
jgi:glutamine synthetase